jgi:hypothetical protein
VDDAAAEAEVAAAIVVSSDVESFSRPPAARARLRRTHTRFLK